MFGMNEVFHNEDAKTPASISFLRLREVNSTRHDRGIPHSDNAFLGTWPVSSGESDCPF